MTKLNNNTVEYGFLLRCVRQFKDDLYSIHKMVGVYDRDSMLEILSYLAVIEEIIDDISDRFIKQYPEE